MKIYSNLTSIILSVGAIHGIILAIILFTIKNDNRFANRILASTLIILAVIMLLLQISHSQYPFEIPFRRIWPNLLYLLPIPMLYFYVKVMTGNKIIISRQLFYHLIPLLFSTLTIIITFHFIINNKIYYHFLVAILSWFTIIISLWYFFLIFQLLNNYTLKIKDNYSNLKKINLKWLKLIVGMLFIVFIIYVFFKISKIETFLYSSDYPNLLIMILFFLIGYLGLKQPVIFQNLEEIPNHNINEKQKYKKSGLTSEKLQHHLNDLQKIMIKEKPYLNSDLDLSTLANKLAISNNHLSQLINEKIGQNFFDYINSHRIEEAKKMLSNPKTSHLKIADIAFNSGFNSLSVFNSAFKKFTKMTPSQFKKNQYSS